MPLLVVGLLVPAHALASSTQEAWMQDDTLLTTRSADQVSQTLDTMKSLGVDRIRVDLIWSRVATGGRPSDPANPASYPASGWAPYDNVFRLALAKGMKIDVSITDGAPRYATPKGPKLQYAWEPRARDFGQFVRAVGRRYSGSYVPPGGLPSLPLIGGGSALPRVSFWTLWNEPNLGAHLAPQVYKGKPVAPRIYRGLVDAGYSALRGTGHAHDTVLFGEFVSKGANNPGIGGTTHPLVFLRSLYCLSRSYHALTGSAARNLGCPTTSAGRKRFRSAHPALFANNTAVGDHPYTQYGRPTLLGNGDDVTITVLGRLERALDRSTNAWGSGRHFPLWVTEYGYQSRPEDPYGVTHAQQAAYINFAERYAARDGRVRSFSQYLLNDEPTGPLGAGFQTGLRTAGGKAKPAFGAFGMPLDLPKGTHAKRGRILVWGDVRRARNGTRPTVRVQVNRKTIARVKAGTHGYFLANVKLPRSGVLRLSWSRFVSRSVDVRK